jgi:hypothetical protein
MYICYSQTADFLLNNQASGNWQHVDMHSCESIINDVYTVISTFILTPVSKQIPLKFELNLLSQLHTKRTRKQCDITLMYKQTALGKRRGNFNGCHLVYINVQKTDPSHQVLEWGQEKITWARPPKSPLSVNYSKIQTPLSEVTSHSKHHRNKEELDDPW